MQVSVVIPCFNERETIREILRRVENAPVSLKEIIVVDDCSTDGTPEILREYASNPLYKVIFCQENQGKGAALRTGFQEATGEAVVVQDADLEYNPADYGALLEPIAAGRADVVYGSRFRGNAEKHMPVLQNRFGNKALTALSNVCSRLSLTDMETCYKMFRREIIQSIDIVEDSFGVEPEITAKIARMNARVEEVGISYQGRTFEEGKKIRWSDGFRAIYAIVRYNLF